MSDPVPTDDTPTVRNLPVPDFEALKNPKPKPRPLKGKKLGKGKPTDPDFNDGETK